MNDERCQQRQDFHASGSLHIERTVRIEPDGSEVNHGLFVRWHANGLKAEEGNYENGLRVGRWRSWLDNGRNFFDGDYIDDSANDPEEPQAYPSAIERFAGQPLEPARRRIILVDLVVVLIAYWLPAMVGASTLYAEPFEPAGSMFLSELNQATNSLASIAILSFVIWKSGDGLSAFGIRKPRWFLDPLIGFITFLVLFEIYARMLSHVYGFYDRSSPEEGLFFEPSWLDLGMLVVALLLNSVAEELAMRAYLMRRVAQLTRSWMLALVVPAFLFGAYHMYEGWVHVCVTTGLGLVFGLIYWWTRRLWPVVICHTLYNLTLYAVSFGYIDWS